MRNVSTHRLDIRSIGRVRVITLDRASKRNALDHTAVIQLEQAWHDFAASDDKVAILRAQGPVFTAGFDMGAPPEQFWRAIPGVGIELGKPVIAAIDGPVIAAGVSLVAFCDLCVASDRSYFVYPEARLGSAAGLIASVVSRIPHKVAMELMLLGRPLSADRAYEVGFVNQVCMAGQETGFALQMAHEMAASSLTVLRFLKSLSRHTLMRSPVESMAVAQMAVDAVATSADALEGTLSRREKRSARFKGR